MCRKVEERPMLVRCTECKNVYVMGEQPKIAITDYYSENGKVLLESLEGVKFEEGYIKEIFRGCGSCLTDDYIEGMTDIDFMELEEWEQDELIAIGKEVEERNKRKLK